MAQRNYIVLVRKDELIDLFKFGQLFTPCNFAEFDGDIVRLSQDADKAQEVFKKVNDFEFSVEYYFLHLLRDRTLSDRGKDGYKFFIEEVQGIYALDSESWRMSLMLTPPVVVNRPIWENFYKDIEVKRAYNDALIGIKNVEKVFGVNFSKLTRDKDFIAHKEDAVKWCVIQDAMLNVPAQDENSIWYYLLRYERHQNYPKDNRGFFLDALHVFANYSKKTTLDASLIKHPLGALAMTLPESVKFNDLLRYVDSDTKSLPTINGVYRGFLNVATLFMVLKDMFEQGLIDGPAYKGMELPVMVDALKHNYDEPTLIRALYLLGFVLGRELTYKYTYVFDQLPFLKK